MNLIPYSIASCSPRSLETCKYLKVEQSDKTVEIVFREFLRSCHLSSVVHVALVPDQKLIHILGGVFVYLLEPLLDVVLLLVCDIVD